MCSSGDTVPVEVKILAAYAFEGVDTFKMKPIDRCIAPLVATLQAGGIDMFGSCCGHGKSDGAIVLADGRTLRIEES